MHGNHSDFIVIEDRENPELRLADPCRVLQNGLKYWLKIAGRTANDSQHLRCRSLLFQCFGQLDRACPFGVEQPRILNRDDDLGGKILHEGDLLISERPHFLAIDDESPDDLVFLEHRHCNIRSSAAQLGRNGRSLLHRIVFDVDYLFCLDGTIESAAWCWRKWAPLPHKFSKRWRQI